MKGRWQLILLVAAVLSCASLAQTQQGHVLLRDVGLYETPATYTELMFSNPGTLPSALKKPNGNVRVSFDIHNVSTAPRSYQWSIAFVHLFARMREPMPRPFERETLSQDWVSLAKCRLPQDQV